MNARKYSETINGTVEFSIAGRYFKLLAAGAAVGVELLNHTGGPALKADNVPAGFYQRVPFSTVRITTSSAIAVEFLVAPDEGGSDALSATLAGSAHSQTTATAAAAEAQMLAANSARKYLLVQNQGANAVYLRTEGSAATATAAAFKLESGQTWEPTVAPTGAIRAIRGGAADCALHIIEA